MAVVRIGQHRAAPWLPSAWLPRVAPWLPSCMTAAALWLASRMAAVAHGRRHKLALSPNALHFAS